MRTSLLLMLVMAVHALTAAPTEAPPSQAAQEQMLMEAMMFQKRGFYSEAEVRLKRLAELQPDQPVIQDLLADVRAKLKAKEGEPVNVLKRKLAETVLPVATFREAAAMDVIQYLQAESGKLTADKSEINFVWLVPPEAKVGPVTLSMKKVPLADVLTYVTQLAGLKYRVDAHAVVVYKPEAVNAKSE